MSVTFTNEKYFATSANQVLWDNQTQASASFFFRYELAGSISDSVVNGCPILGRQYLKSLACVLVQPISGNLGFLTWVEGGSNQPSTRMGLAQGTVYHIAVTHAGGAQILWINGIQTWLGDLSFATDTFNIPFILGGTPPGSPCVYTLSNISLWNGYVLTTTDVANLRDGVQIPSEIGGSASLRVQWTLAGTNDTTPQIGDAGLANNFGNTTYDLTTIGGAGSAVYSAPLVWTPSVGIQTAYVGTSGKTVAVFFENIATSQITLPIESITAPTIAKNGTSLGQLTNTWVTGYHQCVIYCLPSGMSVGPGDVVTLTAPIGWIRANAGITGAISNFPITNLTGRSAFGTDTLIKTLKIGMNFPHLGTYSRVLYQVPKNWRYRLDPFLFGTNSPDGKPISMVNTWNTATIHDLSSANLLDNTGFPGLPGLYAIEWDDLNTSVATSFAITSADEATTTVTERFDLANSGDVNGVGKGRVFNVQRAVGSTVAYLQFLLMVENANKSPQFDNLVIYGPSDFNYQDNTPVVIDRSDPYALSSIFLDRFKYGIGSARWLDSTIGYGGSSNASEPEESRLLTDFTWGEGNHKVNRTISYTFVRPYSTSVSPYIYSTFFGTPFTAILAQNITTTPVAGTQETYGPGYFTNAIAAPILAGLTLTTPSGEIMRVISVSGTDPNATVIVARGAENTTVAQQAATTIQVNNRLAVTGLSMFGTASTVQIVEYVTQSAHGIKTGQYVQYQGTWPPLTGGFTDGSSLFDVNQYNRVVLVTGANTYVATWGNGTAGPVTLSSTTALNPDINQTWWTLSDTGFPQGFVGITTGKLPNCDLHASIPMMASNTLVDSIAREIRDNFPSGRKIWIEFCDEPWNYYFIQSQTGYWMTTFRFPGESSPYTWWIVRTGEICQRFRDRFNEGGRNRGDEIKSLINVQAVDPTRSAAALSIAQAKTVPIDGIAIAPYINPDTSTASVNAWNAADDEQAIDLWIHDLYYYSTSSGWPAMLQAHAANIASYNTATGQNCVLYGYEGGVETTTPGNYSTERGRDMVYNPNWYIIEQDFYAFLQKYGFHHLEIYAYDMAFVNNTNWGMYHSIGQPYGRGDGSDGKADNRLCLATPGKPHTKTATTNQDQQNVSVRGLALIDWMRSMSPARKSRPFHRHQH